MVPCAHGPREKRPSGPHGLHPGPPRSKTTSRLILSNKGSNVFPLLDSVPSRSVPVVTRTLIIANVVVFFFELSLPREAVEQVFYLFGIVPARFTHPEWSAFVGFPINDYGPPCLTNFSTADGCTSSAICGLSGFSATTWKTGWARCGLRSLSDLWDRRGSDAYSYPTGRDCSNCRCLRRDRGRVRRVFVTIPARTAGGDVSRALCAILL